MSAGRLSVSGTLVGFSDESEKVTPIIFETRKKEREIDWDAATASLFADPILISKYAATLAKRSLKGKEGRYVIENIWRKKSFVINALRYGSPLIYRGQVSWSRTRSNRPVFADKRRNSWKRNCYCRHRGSKYYFFIVLFVLVIVLMVWSWGRKEPLLVPCNAKISAAAKTSGYYWLRLRKLRM